MRAVTDRAEAIEGGDAKRGGEIAVRSAPGAPLFQIWLRVRPIHVVQTAELVVLPEASITKPG